ncbi:hypothetical protein N7517_003295 [Penicillium concentricum]|uniref:Uncharacterized protein n=1 Tax=Penicillium concentricum TaxID=293559 RepID=A0A9W9SXC8_9EURO|nr:uncharacterized protein N7517_003295 [Penicillium concentricum]KAJ5385384.1 hypothetical protein N7517_003295 [Penicillium concentricum]
MNNPVALRMTGIINTAFLHRLTLVMRNLGQTPRIRVRPRHLDIIDILDRSLFLSSRRHFGLSSRRRLLGSCLLVLICPLCGGVLIVDRTIAVANKIHPDLGVSNLAHRALADFDAISNLFGDQGRVDASWDLVYGDVAAAAAF